MSLKALSDQVRHGIRFKPIDQNSGIIWVDTPAGVYVTRATTIKIPLRPWGQRILLRIFEPELRRRRERELRRASKLAKEYIDTHLWGRRAR